MVAASNGSIYALTYDSGVFESDDLCVSFVALNSPLQASSLSVSTGLENSPNILYVLSGNQIWKYSGSSWSVIQDSPGDTLVFVASSPIDASVLYASSIGLPHSIGTSALYVSLDGGISWTPAAKGLDVSEVTELVFSTQDAATAYAIAQSPSLGFVAKLNSTATTLIYSTYLSSDPPDSWATGIASSGPGEAVVTGSWSSAFPFESSLSPPPTFRGSYAIAISDSSAACTYRLYPSSQIIMGNPQTVTFGVTAPDGCVWTASSNQTWASVEGGSSGSGFAMIQVDQNGTGTARSASLTVHNATATLTQADSACAYALNWYSLSLPGSGGPGQVSLIAPAACPWTIVNNDPDAITVTTGASGSGNGTVLFVVAPNSDLSARSLSLTIGGLYFEIDEGLGCSFSLTPSSTNILNEGGVGSFGLTASAANCYWTANSNSSWLTLTSVNAGSGSSTLGYLAHPWPGVAARTGTLTIAGQTFTVTQAAGSISPDFNGDGKSDVFLYDPIGGNGYAALSNGSGTFSYINTPFNPGFDIIRPGKLNNDFYTDLIAYNSTNAIGYVLLGTGTGAFNAVSLFWGPGFKTVAAGDLNGDGYTDFVIYRPSDGTMYSVISNGDGTFHYQYTLVTVGFTNLQVADFNGDGKADVFFYRASDGLAYVGLSNGSGGFTFSAVSVGGGYDFIETGDVNGDGKTDLLFYSSSTGAAYIGTSTGSGFTFSPLGTSAGFTSVKMLDYNGDGFADIIFYNQNSTVGYLLIGNGAGGFTTSSLFWGAGMQLVQVSDLNGDGKPDVIIYDTTNAAAYTGLNTGNVSNPFTYTYSYWGTGRVVVSAAAEP